ncbi:MAG: outer membrane beta-barrel protein [Gammaproteobacteria bacterium]|nr:outer membrane beta-barrel protein [Gammaproteobacteria bacterium]
MQKNYPPRRDAARSWCAGLVMSALLLLAHAGTARAGGEGAALRWGKPYAGVFAGSRQADHRVIDVEGFANWGNPGWSVEYDRSGFAGGVLAGWKFLGGGLPLRIEVDGMSGGGTATSNLLDPEGLDETVRSEFRWIATARIGIEHPAGPATVFAGGGLALAGIDSSVTDIDFGPDMPTRADPDDSFRDSSVEAGWVFGIGVEAPLATNWLLRLEGSYLDFGRSSHQVNHSGDGRCGPDGPRRPCPYDIENDLGIVRLAIIRQFGS